MQQVILVNEHDEYVGIMEKLEAHEKALLHRAFSVFIFNQDGKMLLQQRALSKYHSPGLWTNACCSHPLPGEDTLQAALRRMNEELGFSTPLQKAFHFTYKAVFDNGLTEHEFDHVFIGMYNGLISSNSDEVMAVTYKSIDEIEAEIIMNPQQYTEWFKIAYPMLKDWIQNNNFLYAST